MSRARSLGPEPGVDRRQNEEGAAQIAVDVEKGAVDLVEVGQFLLGQRRGFTEFTIARPGIWSSAVAITSGSVESTWIGAGCDSETRFLPQIRPTEWNYVVDIHGAWAAGRITPVV